MLRAPFIYWLTATLAVSTASQPEKEPAAQGKTLSEWLTALKGQDLDLREKAAEALLEIGKPAVAAAVRIALEEPEARMRTEAVRLLGRFGPEEQSAVAALWKILHTDLSLRHEAVNSLVVIDRGKRKEIVAFLIKTANRGFDVQSLEAIGLLGRLGPLARDALPTLKGFLRSKDLEERSRALVLEALAEIDPQEGVQHIALVKEWLKGKELDRYVKAWRFCESLGPLGKVVVPELRAALKDSEGVQRVEVMHALAAIGPEARAAVPELLDLAKDPKTVTRAAGTLQSLGHSAKDGVPALVAVLKSKEDRFVRGEAVRALERIGPDAKEAIPALLEAVADKDEWVSGDAIEAIAKVGGAEVAVPLFRKLLEKPTATQSAIIMKALGRLGPPAKEADADTRPYLKDKQPKVRAYAALAIGQIDPTAVSEVLPVVIEVLKQHEGEARTAGLYALFNFATAARDAELEVVLFLKHKDPRTRARAAAVLARINPRKIPDALSVLEAVLDTAPRDAGPLAVGMLRELGAPATELLRRVTLECPDYYARHRARSALRDLEVSK